ncbi:MAG: site-specific integrase [Bacilli bacterium]|uniref:tyrosine-type recombinase/integrase n=1 Tax=Anaerorhabdus sp. TaxID=1872524 RepID=UPI002FCBFC46
MRENKTYVTEKNGLFIPRVVYYDSDGTRKQATLKPYSTQRKALKAGESYINDALAGIVKQDIIQNSIRGLFTSFIEKQSNESIKKKYKGTTKETVIWRAKRILEVTPKRILDKNWSKFDKYDLEDWLKFLTSDLRKEDGMPYSNNYLSQFVGIILKFIDFLKQENKFRYEHEDDYYQFKLIIKDRSISKEIGNRAYSYLKEEEFIDLLQNGFIHYRTPNENDYNQLISSGMSQKETLEYLGFDTIPFYTYQDKLYKTFFSFLIYGGFRKSELRALRWKDIYMDENLIYIRNNAPKMSKKIKAESKKSIVDSTTKSESSERWIPMLKELRASLEQWIHYLSSKEFLDLNYSLIKISEDSLVFPSSATGCEISDNAIDNALKNSIRQSGVKSVTVHDLRRSCAHYLCYTLRLPKDYARNFLGHESSSELINQVYAKQTTLEIGVGLRDIVNSLSDRLHDEVRKGVTIKYSQNGEDAKIIDSDRYSLLKKVGYSD